MACQGDLGPAALKTRAMAVRFCFIFDSWPPTLSPEKAKGWGIQMVQIQGVRDPADRAPGRFRETRGCAANAFAAAGNRKQPGSSSICLFCSGKRRTMKLRSSLTGVKIASNPDLRAGSPTQLSGETDRVQFRCSIAERDWCL